MIGRKIGMTHVFREDGRPVPVTVLEAGPCTAIQVKSPERDGYRAVQMGFQLVDPSELSKPVQGRFAKANQPAHRLLQEFRLPADQTIAVGDKVTVDLFKPGDRVDVTGRSIGKGFQGGVKRWHWKGGPQTHGSMSHRAPGSIGSSTSPSRVFKGHHLPGRMGGKRVTIQALEVVRVDAAQNLLLIKGALPGHDKAVVLIRKSRKKPRALVQAPQVKKKAAALPAAKAAGAKPPPKAGSPQAKAAAAPKKKGKK